MVATNTSADRTHKPLLRRWKYGAIAFLFLEGAWFMLLHPLVPSNGTGFAIELTAGAVVGVVIYLAVKAILRLSAVTKYPTLCRIAAIVVALSVGVAVFVGAYELRTTMSNNFHYWVFPGFTRSP